MNNKNSNFNKIQQLYCQYCGKECLSINSLKNHECRCKQNPNKINLTYVSENNHKGICGWQKRKKNSNKYIKAKELGLPKPEISEETKQKLSKIWKGRKHSNETKKKISESYKKFLETHPDKIGWIINHSSKKSYAEQYFEEVFINENIPLKYHKQIGRYELDFYNEDLMKYVEIDGHQHTDSEYAIQHDKERNKYLENLGWNGIRINWSEYQKLNFENKQQKIQEIKKFLKLS